MKPTIPITRRYQKLEDGSVEILHMQVLTKEEITNTYKHLKATVDNINSNIKTMEAEKTKVKGVIKNLNDDLSEQNGAMKNFEEEIRKLGLGELLKEEPKEEKKVI